MTNLFRSLSSFIVRNNTSTNSLVHDIRPYINDFIILGFVSLIFGWIGWASWIITAERQIRRIRFKLFRNILRQEIGWFDMHNAGELSNRLIDDLGLIIIFRDNYSFKFFLEKMKDGMRYFGFLRLFEIYIIYSLARKYQISFRSLLECLVH